MPRARVVPLPIFRLSFNLAVLSQEFPVWINLDAGLFSARFDDDLIIPFTVGVVFFFYLNDLSSRHFLLNCFLDRDGKRL